MLKGFREFILRGNVVDLAIAVVIGTAFGAVVNAFVKDFITQLVAAIGGKPDFGTLTFTVNSAHFAYGDFINQVITFLSIAASIYFFVVVPMNRIAELRARGAAPEAPGTRPCPECLSDIPVAARRCAHCTTSVAPAA